MSEQKRWLIFWARTIGMPIGLHDEDRPTDLPIKMSDVYRALLFRMFWIVLHILTCLAIIAGNGRTLGFW
tara:strand:+ start:594 stop:803 length:210 start_codon:yes stop_codon:yes gene_type:complete